MRNDYLLSELQGFIARLYAGKRVQCKPFAYPVALQSTILAAGNSIQTQLRMLANADFICTDLMLSNSDTTQSNFISFTLQIEDSASQERWWNNAPIASTVTQNASTGNGSGANPFLPGPSRGVPRQVVSNTTLTLTWTNASNSAVTINAALTLVGVNVFPLG